MLNVFGSISTKTGLAPQWTTASAVAVKVWETVITSSPGPTPRAMQRQVKGVGARGGRDAVGGAREVGELPFELADVVALDEAGACIRTPWMASVYLTGDRGVLGLEVAKGDLHPSPP